VSSALVEPDLDEERQKSAAYDGANGSDDERRQRALPIVRLQHGIARPLRIIIDGDGLSRAVMARGFFRKFAKAVDRGPSPIRRGADEVKERDYAADMIFQGAFEEMQLKDKSVDPSKLAASLGFAGRSIKTLETGCEIDFHFVDTATAEIGLNDNVYTLKKQ
jgi:hypothetical protein